MEKNYGVHYSSPDVALFTSEKMNDSSLRLAVNMFCCSKGYEHKVVTTYLTSGLWCEDIEVSSDIVSDINKWLQLLGWERS